MQNGTLTDLGEVPNNRPADAMLVLCAGLLPVWVRHLSTSRAQSEVAVTQMMQSFADIGPHINMAERQSQQINDALAQPIGGVTGLIEACEQLLGPVQQDPSLSDASRTAVAAVVDLVRRTVGALEQVSRPFQHETQMVAEQVDRMYIGFQYQDRISQMMALLEADMARLHEVLNTVGGAAPPELATWLARLESQYAMSEQRDNHDGLATGGPGSGQDNETTFF
jgi:methyl-accepting chemotaxis protein